MRTKQATKPTIRAVGAHLLYLSDYDPAAVTMLKTRVPSTERAWDKQSRGWVVTPNHLDTLQDITRQVFGEEARIIGNVPTSGPTKQVKVYRVDYVGAVKQRPDGSRTATGSCDGEWSLTFPESVLLHWFGMIEPPPAEKSTLYQVMGVRPTAEPEEIKKAWRRLALQWHPDRCSEPDAQRQFLAIKEAWEVLGDPAKRRRYDAGLALELSLTQVQGQFDPVVISTGFRPPLRCGWILAEVTEKLPGRAEVSSILAWEDIVDEQGRVMVSSWPAGADTFTVDWVQP